MAEEVVSPLARSSQWRKPPRLYEEIARDLSEAITEGRLQVGEFLPTEQALADAYGASRNVTREALKMLAARGLIEAIHGRGSRVLPRHRWQLLSQVMQLLREDRQVRSSLLELRRIMEVEAAGLAAQRATPEQIALMRDVLVQQRESTAVPEHAIEHDFKFHQLLVEASGNVLLPQVMEPIAQLVRAHSLALAYNPGAVERAVEMHLEILALVEARDVAGARASMLHHLLGVEDDASRILGAGASSET